MKKLNQLCSLLLACTIVTGMAGIETFAATKINSISIKVEANIQPGTDYGEEDIEVTVKTGNCTFVEYEILNEDNEWELDSVPKIKIIIEAADDYVFNITSLSKINVSGGELVGATRAKGSSGKSNTELNVTMTLPSLNNYVGELTTVSLNQDGIAAWEPVMGATSYYVRLYRDGSSAGTVTTSNTTYDFSPSMLRSGNYFIKIRATNDLSEKKSTTTESSSVHVTDEKASQNKDNNNSKAGEWRQDASGWWYCHMDGSFTASAWEKIHGSWFAFDAAGYMQTGWVELDGKHYYFNPENGAMVSNNTIDGYVLGEDGARIQ